MSNPMIMTPYQITEAKAEVARLRAMAAGLRAEADAPRPRSDDDVRDPMALAIAADATAAGIERSVRERFADLIAGEGAPRLVASR